MRMNGLEFVDTVAGPAVVVATATMFWIRRQDNALATALASGIGAGVLPWWGVEI